MTAPRKSLSITFGALCVVINLVLGTVVDVLQIPFIFMDTLGTILSGVLIGPFYGLMVGFSTNFIQGILTNPRNIPFALVNMAIGLVAGFVARRFRFSLPVAVATGLFLAVLAPLVGTPIAVWMYGGLTGDGTDLIFLWLRQSGHKIFTSAFIPRIVGNLADKVATCILASLIIARFSRGFVQKLGGSSLQGRPSRD